MRLGRRQLKTDSHQIFVNNIIDPMNKGVVVVAVGSILLAAFSFYKLIQQRRLNNSQSTVQSNRKSKKSEKKRDSFEESKVDAFQQNSFAEQVCPWYDYQVVEPNPYQILFHKPKHNPDIESLHYDVLLSLNKSKGYEGVVKIRVASKRSLDIENLYIDAIATSILYLAVNGRRIPQDEIIFRNHRIVIKNIWLQKQVNNIEIIFANKYAFMGDGLTCYFPLDQFNKYSLKGQVIYVRNGLYKAPRIFPCLNILNPCEVSLEVLHPNGFNTESNNHKIEMKIATKKDYPRYQFFFYANQKSKNNSSYRLSSSAVSETNSYRSNDEIVKAKSVFSLSKLNSIHDFFLFSSAVAQVRPTINLASSGASSISASSQIVMKDILIRYFTKQHLIKKATSFLNILESQITDIFCKLDQYKKTHKASLRYQCKIDFFFIDDIKAEGDFFSGAVILNQSTIERGVIDRRLYFLLCRSLVGMGMLFKKRDSLLCLEEIIKLNELTLDIFPQCCDYIYVKNAEYQNIRNYCIEIIQRQEDNSVKNKILLTQDEEKENDMKFWVSEYYEKECRYFVRNLEKVEAQVSMNVKNLLQSVTKLSAEDFWTFFISRYPFIEYNVSQVVIKIALREKGVPTGEAELKFAKSNFIQSKYYIKFFTHQEIQGDLKKFLELGTHGIEKVLPFIKIKESCLSAIPQRLESYLYVKENRLDGKKLYEQFKKYNEGNNFHHISALRRELKRIRLLARDSIQSQRREINCGLMGWKLLKKLDIHPQDEETFKLISKLEKVKGKIEETEKTQPSEVEEEAKKLQKLMEDK